MNVSCKMSKIRADLGLSQEYVAEKIDVSRQTVSRWESGKQLPDLDKLIELCNLYQISLDYLVKDNNCTGGLSTDFPEDNMVSFLLEAKLNTYARGKGKVHSSRLNSTDYSYQNEDYSYYDTYVGGNSFCGEEVVWFKDVPVWSMNYSGRTLSDNFNSSFFKEALCKGTLEYPYRGPLFYRNNDNLYKMSVIGNIDWFQGYEEVYFKDELVYECYFHGSYIK